MSLPLADALAMRERGVTYREIHAWLLAAGFVVSYSRVWKWLRERGAPQVYGQTGKPRRDLRARHVAWLRLWHAGMSMSEIARGEVPPVSRQAVSYAIKKLASRAAVATM